MNEKMQDLLSQIAALEEQLAQAIHEQESRIVFQIKGKRIPYQPTSV
jgi:hypothetical protein